MANETTSGHHSALRRSAIPGRERWEIGALVGAPGAAAVIEPFLRAKPGVSGVEANALTGRLLIVYDQSLGSDAAGAWIREALALLDGRGPSAHPGGLGAVLDRDAPAPRAGLRAGLWVGAGALVAAGVAFGGAVAAPILIGAGVVAGVAATRVGAGGRAAAGKEAAEAVVREEAVAPAAGAHPLRRILGYGRRHGESVRRATLLTVINKSLDLAPPFLIALAVDTVSGGAVLGILGVTTVTGQVLVLAGVSVVIWGAESLFEYLYRVEWERFAQDLQHDLRLDAYDHVQHVEMARLEEGSTGKLAATLNDEINQIERFFEDGVAELIGVGTSAVIASLCFVLIAPTLAPLTLLPIPIILWFSLRYEGQIAPLIAGKQEAAAQLNGLLVNNVMGISTVRSFTAEDHELGRVDRMSRAFMEACDPVIRKEAAFTPIIRMAVLFGFAGTMVVGGVLVGAGALTTGSYAFMILLTQRFLWPLTNLGHSITNYQRSMASVNRVLGLLEAPVGPPSGDMPLDPGQVRGDIEFRRVDFSYRASRPVLEGFSLRLPAGRTTAIVGVTGAGKTTIAKLLLRFYDHGGGQILIDGEDIRRLRTRDLRGAIGLVSQDVFLFDGTILENIAYGRPDATMEEIVEAARIAELHAFVEQLPDGYRTVVGERGVKLSGGQRQRICIARAVLKDPPILVLDEATSSVDNETEAAIQRSLDRISKERTTLIIAHRLSTVRNADAIHVLGDRGRIVEEGRHDELIAQDGVYAALWRVQTGEA